MTTARAAGISSGRAVRIVISAGSAPAEPPMTITSRRLPSCAIIAGRLVVTERLTARRDPQGPVILEGASKTVGESLRGFPAGDEPPGRFGVDATIADQVAKQRRELFSSDDRAPGSLLECLLLCFESLQGGVRVTDAARELQAVSGTDEFDLKHPATVGAGQPRDLFATAVSDVMRDGIHIYLRC